MQKRIWFLAIALMIHGFAVAQENDDGDDPASAYKKSKIKNRAALQAKRGLDDIAGKRYIYLDDRSVDAAIAKQNGKDQISIGSVALKKGTHLKEVNILVKGDGKKSLEVKNTGMKPAEVKIGHVTEEKGSSVKRVQSIIEMEVDVKSK
jgi:hypothetical protein